MHSNNIVSIIIASFNYGHFLSDALQSVIEQTYQDWECIVVDDGSTDNTSEVVKRFEDADKRIRYLYKSNGGLSSARNYGIKASRGAFVGFLDADDKLDAEKLRGHVKLFLEHKHVDIVYGNAMFFNDHLPGQLFFNKDQTNQPVTYAYRGKGDDLLKLLLKQNITVVSAPLIRKEVFEKVGFFDPGFKSYEDWHFWTRCAIKDCYFYHSTQPAVCTYIRFGHESMMSNNRKLAKAGIRLRFYLLEQLPVKFAPYNMYRLIRSILKLMTS